MDGAIRLLQSAEPCFVSAEDIADQFHGLVPDTIRFVCPYCSRPVDAFAMRNIAAHRAGHPDMRNMRPHFRHHKNDERARHCPFYDGVDAITDFRAERIALLPMFLRKSGSGFVLEIGIRYDPSRLAKTSDEHIEIEGRPYPISDFSRRRSFKVRLENPSLSFTTLVKLPDDDVTGIGNIDDSKLLIFDDAFGAEGGHRLAPGSSLHPERAYFVVTPATYPLSPPRGVDARRVGSIPSSHGTLIVYRIAFVARKREWITVSDWLDSLGFELAAYERRAQCLWPPILQSSGADEPLLRYSTPVYSSPYQISAASDTSRVNVLRIGRDFRDIALIGFDSDAGNTASFEHETVGHCVFFRPGPFHHWCSVIDDFAPVLGLQLAPSPYTSEDFGDDETKEPSEAADGNADSHDGRRIETLQPARLSTAGQRPPMLKNSRGKIVAIARITGNRHELIAQQSTSAAFLRGPQHR